MIQRKQTLFLLAIVALLASMMFFPIATSSTTSADTVLTGADGTITKTSVMHITNIKLTTWTLSYDDVEQVQLTYLAIILCLATVICAATIFLFKFRLLQIRLCYAMGVFLMGIIGYEILYLTRLSETVKKAMEEAPHIIYTTQYSITATFPLIALILLFFAYRGIIKDESLVRSLDRIR